MTVEDNIKADLVAAKRLAEECKDQPLMHTSMLSRVTAIEEELAEYQKSGKKELTTDSQLHFIMKVLKITSAHDITESLYWRCDGKYAPVTFMINCNDIFGWACSDSEYVTPENVDMLDQACKDVRDITKQHFNWEGPMLFCARLMKSRPQGVMYPDNKDLWPLFDAVGPEREVGLGNPYKPGDYGFKCNTQEKIG